MQELLVLNQHHIWFALAVDERCDMELDETDPAVWLKLEAAVEEYIQNNSGTFKNVCERLLLPHQHDDKFSEILKAQQFHKAKVSNAGMGDYILLRFSLGFHNFEYSFC